MEDFYGEMREMTSELLGELKQGVVSLRRVTRGTGPNSWTPGEPTSQDYGLSASVKRNATRRKKNSDIFERGDVVVFAVPEVEPLTTDSLVIDGIVCTITDLTPIPGAGPAVAYKAWCGY